MKLNKREIQRISFRWVFPGVVGLIAGFGSAMASPFPDDRMFPQLNMENFDAEKQLRPPYMVPPKLSRSSSNFEEIVKCSPTAERC
jgi:hypothetical protein